MISLLTCLLLLQPPAQGKWAYTVPAATDAFHHAPLRILPLSDQRPPDVTEEVKYQGSKQRYAQFHYGNPSSTRVAVVLDDLSAGRFDLYVDANRNRVIESAERVNSSNLSWQLPLAAVILEGTVQTRFPRQVLFRYGPATRSLSYATCGFLEGETSIAGETLRVRRVDGDANGLFADAQDRVWIDLDGFGRWDPIDHQFPFVPVLTLNKQRYVAQSDAGGERFLLRPLEGIGKVQLQRPRIPAGATVEAVSATLYSKDGIVATLTNFDTPTVLPVGEYAFTGLTLVLRQGEAETSYVFSANGTDSLRWHKLEKNGSLTLDPAGTPRLEIGLSDDNEVKAGNDLLIQPQFYTGTNLLINIIFPGRDRPVFSDGPRARIRLLAGDRSKIAESSSGFA
jgi:hypothetical protein